MTTISVSQFKARCLKLMESVSKKRESFIITKRGVPIAKVIPLQENVDDLRESLRGSVLESGDLISPIDVEWDAAK